MSLEFYTSDELITELFGRATFVGAMVYLKEDWRGKADQLEKTHLIKNIPGIVAAHLLNNAAQAAIKE